MTVSLLLCLIGLLVLGGKQIRGITYGSSRAMISPRTSRLIILNTHMQSDCDDDSVPSNRMNVNVHTDEEVSGISKCRRVRYPGKYPKLYNQKYKEISGNLTVVEKVLQKGGTPAGQHISVMLEEVVGCLNPSAGNDAHEDTLVSVDCTLGYGGHSVEIINGLMTMEAHNDRPGSYGDY